MHEIITLQLGQRSNHLATHFWNTQVDLHAYHVALAHCRKSADIFGRNHTLHILQTKSL